MPPAAFPPTVEQRNAAERGPCAVDHERRSRLLGAAKAGVLYRRHEAAALHLFVVRELQRRIDRNARNPFGLEQVGQLFLGKFPCIGFHRRVDLVRMGAPVKIIKPLRPVHLGGMFLPNSEKQLPVLPRNVEIDVAVAAGKNSCRRHGSMLAPLAHENLPLVGEQPNDMLVGGQPFLHRHVDVIAAAGALAPIKRRQHTRRREDTGKVESLGFRRLTWRQ